jgi:general secretion pathway protein G
LSALVIRALVIRSARESVSPDDRLAPSLTVTFSPVTPADPADGSSPSQSTGGCTTYPKGIRMLKRLRELRSDEGGFTLIELLIVVVILGVLSGIVVFAVSAFNNDGVTAACKSDMKSVEIADEAYFAKTGSHAASAAALVSAGYLKEEPKSDKYTVTVAGGVVTGTLAGGAACVPVTP